MMKVDTKKCTGCGQCIEVCAVEAIHLARGKAVIDADICLSCGSCSAICPAGAILEDRYLVMPTAVTYQPAETGPSSMVVLKRARSLPGWSAPVLSFVGQEIVPRLADALLAALDRRISHLSNNVPAEYVRELEHVQAENRRRQLRRRRRGLKI